ncbi:cadmium resistance transporter [Paraburkholderia gardini]|uniref:cadmium resistance transporter n=1 Tax=Paraburkholderia gardini TaxID=2823469 RepID=UPI001DD74CE2|nr:cadmium resistance transporter [Paraburkholderia gardini]CAG4900004.1 hypothetical protein R69919_02684 [Paraburkholderia gardini]
MALGGLAASILLAFVTSSLDDFVLLACLYADWQASSRRITAAKLVCALLSLVAGIALAIACLALPLTLSRIAGLVPLALGVKRLIDARTASSADTDTATREAAPGYARTSPHGAAPGFARLLSILLAASLDNIALYIPLFTHGNRPAIVPAIAIVLPMTLLLCALAFMSSRLRVPLRMRRLRADAVVPYLMMFIGMKALAASFF